MQFVHLAFRIAWDALAQSLSQQVREEMVIAVPMPLVVQGDDEQVGAVEQFQGGLPGSGGVEQNGITQRTAQALQDRGAQQKRLDAFRLLLEKKGESLVDRLGINHVVVVKDEHELV